MIKVRGRGRVDILLSKVSRSGPWSSFAKRHFLLEPSRRRTKRANLATMQADNGLFEWLGGVPRYYEDEGVFEHSSGRLDGNLHRYGNDPSLHFSEAVGG